MSNKKETKSVVVKEKGKLLWIGSQVLTGRAAPNSKEEKEQLLVRMVAKVLNVSPFGINILGSVPYINKLGLKQKSEQYAKGKDELKYNWIQRALDDTQKAVCECKVVCNDKDMTDWITGECSPKTMKMSTLAGYQNHMAQTRARNRAILELYSVRIHEEMLTNIAKLLEQKKITEIQANALLNTAGKASAASMEEMSSDNEKTAKINNDLFPNFMADDPAPKAGLRAGQVIGPDRKPVYLCSKDDATITEAEANYSLKVYGKRLCRLCQKTAKPIKK